MSGDTVHTELFDGHDPRLERCLAIRRVVFIEEQEVAEELEIDGLDPDCTHVLLTTGGDDLGTARLRLRSPEVAKIERVAVLAHSRRQGLGELLMRALHVEARRRGCTEAVLGAQNSAMGFYEGLGYEAYGPEFLDAGIPHHMMRLPLG